MRDVRIPHPQVEQDVVPAPTPHAVEERLKDDVDTRGGQAGVASPGTALARVVVDLRDVLGHDDTVVVRRHERRGREDPVEPFGLVGVERIAGRRHPLELLREREPPVVGARLEVLEGPVGRAGLWRHYGDLPDDRPRVWFSDARAAQAAEAPRDRAPGSGASFARPEDPDPPREGLSGLGTHAPFLFSAGAPRGDDPGGASPGRADQRGHPGPLHQVPSPGGLRGGAGGSSRAGYQGDGVLQPEGEVASRDGPRPSRGVPWQGAVGHGWPHAAAWSGSQDGIDRPRSGLWGACGGRRPPRRSRGRAPSVRSSGSGHRGEPPSDLSDEGLDQAHVVLRSPWSSNMQTDPALPDLSDQRPLPVSEEDEDAPRGAAIQPARAASASNSASPAMIERPSVNPSLGDWSGAGARPIASTST